MSNCVRALLTSRKESISAGTTLCTFELTHTIPDNKPSDTFDVLLVDKYLDAALIIQRESGYRCFYWTSVSIRTNGKKLFGSFEIEVARGRLTSRWNQMTGSFDTTSATIRKNIDRCSLGIGSKVKIRVQVYYEDGRCYSPANDKLWMSRDGTADFTFVVEGQRIPVHRSILAARNEVFGAMLSADMKEKRTNEVEIVDEDPDVFGKMLRFVYSGELDSKDSNVEELLQLSMLAHKYSVGSLANLCAYWISGNLTVDNVIEVLYVADLVDVTFLKRECIKFIAENRGKLEGMESYARMVESDGPSLLREVFRQVMRLGN